MTWLDFDISFLVAWTFLFLFLPGGLASAQGQPEISWAQGVVYHDKDGDRQRDHGEPGIAGVRVSNGRDVVTTDRHGVYRITVDADAVLFVSKPSGWMCPLDQNNLPQFYYIHKPDGSPPLRFPGIEPTGPLPGSVDFPLYQTKEPRQFSVVVFGDVQVRDERDVAFFSHDIVEELVGVDAAFGITLGDIVYGNLPLFESVNRTVAQIGIPWSNVIGNHDLNQDAPNDRLADEAFERVYGPTYYSFDYGRVHFVVLDNVFVMEDDALPFRRRLRSLLGADQLEFLSNDLDSVPRDRLVILLMHMPLLPEYSGPELEEIFRLLGDRPFTFSLSAHLHRQHHRFITKEDGWPGSTAHHHLVHGAACGSIWAGEPDEFGIPHATMCCGAPNGYSIITFDGGRLVERADSVTLRPHGAVILNCVQSRQASW